MSTFADLGLSESLLSTLAPMGLVTPTDIQEKAIPVLLGEPRDFIGMAQTGTGKTAAFALPLLERLDHSNPVVQAIILSPTRELGQQTAKQLKTFSGNSPLNVEVVYGGASIQPQIRALRRPVHAVVATPGRLIDLIERKAVRLDNVSYIILDEADEMLNMGFREEIDKILEHTADHAVTWLFSATIPRGIRHIVKNYMKDPVEVTIEQSQRINENIEHLFSVTKVPDRVFALRRFIDLEPAFYGVVFCRTKIATEKLADELIHAGLGAEAINGDLSQQQRNQVMHRFKSRNTTILVATDVAARGIDVTDLTHVVHFDLPADIEAYTHRSGRTARAGKKGISLSLISKGQLPRIKQLERALKISMRRVEVPTMADVSSRRVAKWAESLAAIVPEAEIPATLLETVEEHIKELDRDALVQRLLTQELSRLGWSPKSRETKKSRDDVKENFAPVMPSPTHVGPHRYFINAGSMDRIQKGDLLRLICDQTGLSGDQVGNIDLREKHSFFELLDVQGPKMEKAFRGLQLRGRRIRVTLEPEGGSGGNSGDRGRDRASGPRPYRSREPRQGRGASGGPRNGSKNEWRK